MKQGAKYKFFIPQELAYGESPRPGGPIKPYMALIFEVELLEVK
jgi:FKBP-type peptidyl-prolyl cis-trans isomerase FklB